jgi:hypothetical protein
MVFSSEEPSFKISFNHAIYRLTSDFQLTIRAEPKFEFNAFTFVKSSRNHKSKSRVSVRNACPNIRQALSHDLPKRSTHTHKHHPHTATDEAVQSIPIPANNHNHITSPSHPISPYLLTDPLPPGPHIPRLASPPP